MNYNLGNLNINIKRNIKQEIIKTNIYLEDSIKKQT